MQGLFVRGAGDAALGDDGSYVLRRGHIEGGILNRHAFGRHLPAGDVSDFLRIALLDRNRATVGAFEIDRRNRRGHVERDAMLFG